MKNVNLGIIGLGYVGLPLAVEFGKKYNTTGFDININRIEELCNFNDRTLEVTNQDLKGSANLNFTSNINDLKNCNVYIVAVPTPIDKYNVPDLSLLLSASKSIGQMLIKEDIVIYESTVFPGATEEYCVPMLEKHSGLKYNEDFFCGYSPERINPGDKHHTLTNITKVVSGSNESASEKINNLYKSIIKAGTYKASSISVAEAAKVIENVQRDVNIALMNELAVIFNKLDIDTLEVLKAAGTKWNFLDFRPGLVGGHCIGVDPYYLTYKCSEIGYHPDIILTGRRTNDRVSQYIAETTISLLIKNKINLINSRIGVLGLTFKENCPDLRNSKVFSIIAQLSKYGCNLLISDLYVDKEYVKNKYNIEIEEMNQLDNMDAIILAVAHDEYISIPSTNWNNMYRNKGIFVDIKAIYDLDYFQDTNIVHWRF